MDVIIDLLYGSVLDVFTENRRIRDYFKESLSTNQTNNGSMFVYFGEIRDFRVRTYKERNNESKN